MELTQEHFDKSLSNLLEKVSTKDDLTNLEIRLKKEMAAQTEELKAYTTDSFEVQQQTQPHSTRIIHLNKY